MISEFGIRDIYGHIYIVLLLYNMTKLNIFRFRYAFIFYSNSLKHYYDVLRLKYKTPTPRKNIRLRLIRIAKYVAVVYTRTYLRMHYPLFTALNLT